MNRTDSRYFNLNLHQAQLWCTGQPTAVYIAACSGVHRKLKRINPLE